MRMLESAKLMGFVLTKDYKRAREFYEGKLGCEFVSHDQFALAMTIAGNAIRIVKVPDFTPLQSTVLGWQVPDIAAVVAWLRKQGVTFEKYPFVEDPTGIWTAPGGDKVAWFKDPDGNVLSVSQHQPSVSGN
jgi:catechol 2,3-dioxygenase-like lactoylglutathione lyase family enzyme